MGGCVDALHEVINGLKVQERQSSVLKIVASRLDVRHEALEKDSPARESGILSTSQVAQSSMLMSRLMLSYVFS